MELPSCAAREHRQGSMAFGSVAPSPEKNHPGDVALGAIDRVRPGSRDDAAGARREDLFGGVEAERAETGGNGPWLRRCGSLGSGAGS